MKKIIIIILAALALSGCPDTSTQYFTVSFDSNGGTPVPDQAVASGSTVAVPEQPDRPNYVFLFWSLEGTDTAYNFQTPITGNITLVANWQEESTAEFWQVSWVLNGGAWPVNDNHAVQVVKGGTLAEPATPVKTDCTFEGWYRETGLTNKILFPYDVSSVIADITLYAKWIDTQTTSDALLIIDYDNTPFRVGIDGGWLNFSFITELFSQVTCDQTWCEFEIKPYTYMSEMDGNYVSIYVQSNASSNSSREAIITVTAGDETAIVSVRQAGTDSDLSIFQPYNNYHGLLEIGDTVNVTVYTNYKDWNVECEKTWCTVSRNPDSSEYPYYSFSITVPENTDSFRTATITVSTDDFTPVWTTNAGQRSLQNHLMAVGSFYYSDDTFSHSLDASKTCIGVASHVLDFGSYEYVTVVSLDEFGPVQWTVNTSLRTNATDLNNGKTNQTTIQNIASWQTVFPAFAWCAANGDGWYFPAKNEVNYFSGKINSRLEATGGTPFSFGTKAYWSSSETSATWAWIYGSGGWLDTAKTINAYVRAVKRIVQ